MTGNDLFDDDVAADVRASLDVAMSEGIGMRDATREVLDEYQDHLGDDDDRGIIWLALAMAQIEHGQLQSEVLQHALTVVDTGEGLGRWEGDDDEIPDRVQTLLDAIREQLMDAEPMDID